MIRSKWGIGSDILSIKSAMILYWTYRYYIFGQTEVEAWIWIVFVETTGLRKLGLQKKVGDIVTSNIPRCDDK